MNQTLEERLKEAMERRAADLPVALSPPVGVVRRTRRRQTMVATLAAVAAVAVLVGSFIGVRELWTGAQRLGGNETQSSTVNGVTISYPEGWHFEDTLEQSGGSSPVLFILANYSPPSSFLQVGEDEVCRPDAAVLALQEDSIGPGRIQEWPAELRSEPSPAQGCGDAETAAWAIGGRSFQAYVLFGRNVSSEDRVALLGAFSRMRFGQATVPLPSPPSHFSGGTVVARGTTTGQAWTVSVEGSGTGLTVSAEGEGQGVGIGMARTPSGRIAPLSVAALRLGTGPEAPRVVFGLASAAISSVHVEPTHEVGKMYPIPGNMEMQVFVVLVNTLDPRAVVVGEDERGKVLVQEPLGPNVVPIDGPPGEQVSEAVVDSGVTDGVRWTLVGTFSGSEGAGLELRYGNKRAGFAPGNLKDAPLTVDTAVVGQGPNAEDFVFGSMAPWVASVELEGIRDFAVLYRPSGRNGVSAFLAHGIDLVKRARVLVARSASGASVHSQKIRPDPEGLVTKG